MLLVRRVSGPARARVGTVAVYRVIEFNEPNPSPEEKSQINWVVQSDGQTVSERHAEGETLRFEVPASLGGKTIRVMPFRNEPTPRVSVVTSIEGVAGVSTGGETQPSTLLSPKIVRLEREGSRYFANIDNDPRFYVGTDVRYEGLRGLMNTSDEAGQPYHPDNYRDQYGFWADFIYPTARCESEGYFQRINTYDRARFTFGFFQDAVHEPNDNFVLLLRKLLGLPAAQAYFPDLILSDDAVHRRTARGLVRLETPTSTSDLMNYLNPSGEVVDEIEAINAAKFIHWSLYDPAHRAYQVAFTIESMKRRMQFYAQQYGLHGVVDTVCLVVADIRHQGRAKSRYIIEALESSTALSNLLEIGEDAYPERIATLRAAIAEGEERGVLGTRKYDRATGDFVSI